MDTEMAMTMARAGRRCEPAMQDGRDWRCICRTLVSDCGPNKAAEAVSDKTDDCRQRLAVSP